jgi:hypothetical protein
MTKKHPHEAKDDLPSELRKALIECGAVIPTTPEEVLLAERQHKVKAPPVQIEAAFKKLELALDDPTDDLSFAKLNDPLLTMQNEELAMAARNGTELDEETRAKIEASVQKTLRKPSQDSKK